METAERKDFGIYTAVYYTAIKSFESGKCFPNVKAIRKQASEAKKTVRELISGAAFCPNMEALEETERAIKNAKDKYNAMAELLNFINKKLREA